MSELPSRPDSVLAVYTGDVRWRLEGPPEECARSARIGRMLLGEIRHLATLNGLGVIARQIVLGDGTVIGAMWDGSINQVYIRAANLEVAEIALSITLETGMVDVRKQTANPWLYYGAREQAAWHGGCPKWLDELMVVVRQVQQDDLTPPASWDLLHCGRVRTPVAGALPSVAFQGTPEGFHIRNERADLRYPSPGYATGRLKLYVQALLGSLKSLDYVRADHEGAEDDWTKKVCTAVRVLLPLNELADGPTWTGYSLAMSRGLFVTDGMEYWVIFIDDTDIRAAKVRLSVEGMLLRQAWLAHLKREPTTSWRESSKTEAYILSGAVSLDDPMMVAEGLLADIKGHVIHEGWKFNYSGHEARIVTDETIYGDPPDEADYNVILKHTFRQYKISLTYTQRKEDEKQEDWKPFTASLEAVEEVNATPEMALWVGSPLSGQYMMLWYDWHEWRIGLSRGYLEHLEFDAPVYGFYQMDEAGNEEWVTLRVEYHKGLSDSENVVNSIMAEMRGVSIAGGGHQEAHRLFPAHYAAPEVFYLKTTQNLLDLEARWIGPAADETLQLLMDYSLTVTPGGGGISGTTWGVTCYEVCPNPPTCEGFGIHGTDTLYPGTWEGSMYQAPRSYIKPELARHTVAILPYGEGQAVYLVKRRTVDIKDRWAHFFNNTAVYFTFVSDLGCNAGAECGGPLTFTLESGGLWAHGLAQLLTREETRQDTTTWDYELVCIGSKAVGPGLSTTLRYRTPKTRLRFRGSLTPEVLEPGDPYTVDQQLGNNNTFFNTDLEYPYIGYPINAVESWSGDLRYLSQLADVTADQTAVFHPLMTNSDTAFPALDDTPEILFTGWA